MIYNEICKTGSKQLNTGAKGNCLEALTVMLFLSKESFAFANVDDFKDKTKWEDAIKNKDIVPLFEVYELAIANTEPTFFESRNFRKMTAKAEKATTVEMYLSLCADRAVRSYQDSEYTRIFEVTEDGDIIGVMKSDGSVVGQRLKDFSVGTRQAATTEKPPTTMLTLTYADSDELSNNGAMVTPNFDPVTELNGIFDINLTLVSATATDIVFKATYGCGAMPYASLSDTSIALLKADGTAQSAFDLTYSADTEQYHIGKTTPGDPDFETGKIVTVDAATPTKAGIGTDSLGDLIEGSLDFTI